MDLNGYTPVVIGLILISLNAARAGTCIPISIGSLATGVLCLTFGGARLLGYALPLVPAIVVLIVSTIVIDAVTHPENRRLC
jgi:CHASE2 domain-containing sensor protein